MSNAVLKALQSVFVNTVVFAVGLLVTQFESIPDQWAIIVVLVLKVLQQVLARWAGTGGEIPQKKAT
jgi:hypothetical protein